MTFTYNLDTPNDITRVRYHLQDTDSAVAIFSDEEISFVLGETGSVGGAVVSLIRAAMTKLAHEPDGTADWLRVDWRRSADTWRGLLRMKEKEFGLGATGVARGIHVHRLDGRQKTEPRYIYPLMSNDDDLP
jgi:hypothetical protein